MIILRDRWQSWSKPFLVSDQVPLVCPFVAEGFWAWQGLLATGLAGLLLSGVEDPILCCSSRASLAGGGRGFAARSLLSVFFIPWHAESICSFTLIQTKKWNIQGFTRLFWHQEILSASLWSCVIVKNNVEKMWASLQNHKSVRFGKYNKRAVLFIYF